VSERTGFLGSGQRAETLNFSSDTILLQHPMPMTHPYYVTSPKTSSCMVRTFAALREIFRFRCGFAVLRNLRIFTFDL
jgi:hypothetical protein